MSARSASTFLEVSNMEVRQQRVLPAWTGFSLAVLGLLVLAVSFFLLPLDVVPCFDSCAQPQLSATAWEYSLTSLRNLPVSLVFNVCLLMLSYLPLLAAVAVVACSFGFLVRPHRAFARWGHRARPLPARRLVPVFVLWWGTREGVFRATVRVRPVVGREPCSPQQHFIVLMRHILA